MESIRMVIDWVNNLLWGKNILVVMLIGTALYFTVRTRFMQFRLFGDIIRILKDNKTNDKDGVSSLETFFLGTACRVGAGNISGVVAAVYNRRTRGTILDVACSIVRSINIFC